jgi:hypothetical protein
MIDGMKAIQIHTNPTIADIFNTRLEAGSFMEHNVFQAIGLKLSGEEGLIQKKNVRYPAGMLT